MKMFCSHCGKELREAAAFCIYCGMPTGRVEPFTRQQDPIERKAAVSLVCGVVSLLTFGGLLILPIIGLFLGWKARRSGAATMAICLNAAAFVLFLCWLALLLPAISASREAARRMQCVNHIKQIVLAFHNYHDAHGALPPLHTVNEEGEPLHSWRVLILPYIGHQTLYGQIRLDEPWDSEHNRQFHNQMPGLYMCPSYPGDRQRDCTYSVIAGEGFIPAEKAEQNTGKNFRAIADGMSNTTAVVEVAMPFNWMDPTADITLDDLASGTSSKRLGSFHSGGAVFGLFDGSIRFVSDIDLVDLRAAGTIAGGERTAPPGRR